MSHRYDFFLPIKGGNNETVIAQLQELRRQQPTNGLNDNFIQGVICDIQNDDVDTIYHYNLAIAEGDVNAMCNLYLYYNDKKITNEKSLDLLKCAVDRGHARAMNILGNHNYHAGNYEQAKLLYKASMEGNYPKAFGNLFRMLVCINNIQEATSMVNMIVERNNPDTYGVLASYFNSIDNQDLVIKYYKLDTAVNNSVNSIFNLAKTYGHLGNKQLELETCLMGVDRGCTSCMNLVSSLYIKVKDYVLSEKYALMSLQTDDNLAARVYLADVYNKTNDGKALPLYQYVVDNHDKLRSNEKILYPYTLRILADCYEQTKNYGLAAHYYMIALEVNPSDNYSVEDLFNIFKYLTHSTCKEYVNKLILLLHNDKQCPNVDVKQKIKHHLISFLSQYSVNGNNRNIGQDTINNYYDAVIKIMQLPETVISSRDKSTLFKSVWQQTGWVDTVKNNLLSCVNDRQHNVLKTTECPICLVDIINIHNGNTNDSNTNDSNTHDSNQLLILSCRHQFCCHCLSQWMNINNNCPLCKSYIM